MAKKSRSKRKHSSQSSKPKVDQAPIQTTASEESLLGAALRNQPAQSPASKPVKKEVRSSSEDYSYVVKDVRRVLITISAITVLLIIFVVAAGRGTWLDQAGTSMAKSVGLIKEPTPIPESSPSSSQNTQESTNNSNVNDVDILTSDGESLDIQDVTVEQTNSNN